MATAREILEEASNERSTSTTTINDLSAAIVSKLKVAELKEELSMRCLSTKGKKGELATRLLVVINGPDFHGLNGLDRLADLETDNECSGQETNAEAQESQDVLTEKDKTRSKVMNFGKHDRSFDELSFGLGSIRTPKPVKHDHQDFSSFLNIIDKLMDDIR